MGYNKIEGKNPVAVMEALKEIAAALKSDWPVAAAACKATQGELQKLLASLQIMSHPKDFIYHIGEELRVNGVDIYTNMNDSVGHWKKSEYHDFGFSLGTALHLLVIGKENEIYA